MCLLILNTLEQGIEVGSAIGGMTPKGAVKRVDFDDAIVIRGPSICHKVGVER